MRKKPRTRLKDGDKVRLLNTHNAFYGGYPYLVGESGAVYEQGGGGYWRFVPDNKKYRRRIAGIPVVYREELSLIKEEQAIAFSDDVSYYHAMMKAKKKLTQPPSE